jgi:hypothetical protein
MCDAAVGPVDGGEVVVDGAAPTLSVCSKCHLTALPQKTPTYKTVAKIVHLH